MQEIQADEVAAVRRRHTKRKRTNLVLGAGVLVLALAAVGFAVWAARGSTQTASRYSTAQVTKDTVVVTVSASGNMVVDSEQSVSPKVSGTVDKLNVKLGQKVKAGDVLYTISNDGLDTAVVRARSSWKQAKQGLQRARISLAQAEQQLDALESQTGTRTATDEDIDIAERQVSAAKTGVSAAQDDVEAALAAYNAAKDDASARTVTAPMGGTITALTLAEGDSSSGGSSGSSSAASGGSSSGGSSSNGGSSSGTASSASNGSSSSGSGTSNASSGSLVISDLSSLIARVQVNEVDLPSVKIGQKASLTFDAITDLTLSGKVTNVAISGTNSQGVVTYDVDIVPTSLDPRVKSNMSVSAVITTAVRPDVVAVPNAAVKSDTNGTYVQVLGADGTAQRVDVTAGAAGDSLTEIKEGLTVGQNVVTADLSSSTSTNGSGNRTGGVAGGGAFRMMGGGR
jgi:macrolide-specific efflux system membrane fusion protein